MLEVDIDRVVHARGVRVRDEEGRTLAVQLQQVVVRVAAEALAVVRRSNGYRRHLRQRRGIFLQRGARNHAFGFIGRDDVAVDACGDFVECP